MHHSILQADWFTYDNHQIIGLHDPLHFSTEDSWEVHFLVTLLQHYYPLRSITELESRVITCGQQMPPPRLREPFVQCVTAGL